MGEFDPGERFDDPESVKVLLPIVREVLAEERARGRHLDQQAGAFSGFVAIALSLEAGLAPNAYGGSLLACQSEAIFTAMFVLAIGSLLTAAGISILGVLAPQPHPGVSDETIDGYSDRPKVITSPADLRITELRTLTDVAVGDRRAYDRKARRLTYASIALAIGVLGISGQAVTIAFA